MSETKAPPAPPLPLFFKRVVGVNPQLHSHLKLDRTTGYAFATKAQSVPIGLTEFDAVAQHFPILFTTGPAPVPVALLGLREGENLFVRPDGAWQPDTYVPAYVRAFPFIFVEDAANKNVVVGMEPDAEQIRPDKGQPLFEDGRPSAALNEAVGFCQAFREAVASAANFGRALEAAKLLEEEEATVNFTIGGTARIRGFKIVKPERLAEVDDATFLDWRRMGYLNAVYAHLFSAGRWGRLIELGAPRAATTH
jgi:SapC protein